MLVGFLLGVGFTFLAIFGAAAVGVSRQQRRREAEVLKAAKLQERLAPSASNPPSSVIDLAAEKEARRRARNRRKATRRGHRL